MTAAVEWDNLAQLAEAATPGPWVAEYSREQGNCVLPPDAHSTREAVAVTRLYHQQADTEFIAAANPATILRLIAENRDLSERLAQAYRDEVLAHDERDRLTARLAAVDEVIRIHDTTTDIDGGGRGLVPTDTLRAALATDTTKET